MDLDKLIMYTVVAFFYITSPGPAIFLAVTNGMTGKMKIVCISFDIGQTYSKEI
jgi:threonine/homoserine/homoserine lactone efflux protein